MLRIDRLTTATDRLAELIESVEPERIRAAMPEPLRLVDRAARVVRVDLIATLRTMALDSLRRLPAQAAQSPAASDAWFQHALALVAWLDGQTDRTPPLLVPGFVLGTESPSSADPEPERPPSSDS